jgi:sigma-E factor negative regulatory protein RseC
MLNYNEVIEEGIVESYNNGTAVVKVLRKDACNSCSAKGFCSSSNDENKVSAKSEYNLKAGDFVRISIPEKNITSASTYIYGIPLLLMISGLILGHLITNENKEIFSSLLVLLLIALYSGIVYFYSRKKDFSSFMPRIVFINKITPE